ncbi:hypothetical protein RX235_004719 [Salmonella enterica]|nr:hypothetical protein [Klebsiella sp. HMSC09D12]ELL8195826.1 hypothetical protein [Salmonella enterica]EMA5506097.1 hypothetical protein [Salmonella enterica]OFV55936.1 hypothetical protein HMPREF3178_01030 [Klebsiella sp. HMSC09D12]
MNRNRKLLLAAAAGATAGWLCTIILATSLVVKVGHAERRAESAEADAATWKRQAGKAYTELVKARAGTDNAAVLIPAGTRIDCTMQMTTVDGLTTAKCESGTIYPPRDY